MTVEEWRPIPGYAGYEVSSLGRVLSHQKWRGTEGPRLLAPQVGHFGYPYVQLCGVSGAPRNRRMRSVHTLVALAFLGPRPAGQEVRHLDGDPANCGVSNLAYGTKRENEADKRRHGTDPSSRTHCVNGHAFDDVNTHRDPRTGRRYCRPCTRVNSRRYRARLAGRDRSASAA
jgi:hypothetical protein